MSDNQPPPIDDLEAILGQYSGQLGLGAGAIEQAAPIGGFVDDSAFEPREPERIQGRLPVFGATLKWDVANPDFTGPGFTGYFDGDDMSLLNAMTTEELARFQDAAVTLGLTAEVIPGRIDDNTARAMGTLMALGNRQGERWQSVLDGLVRSGVTLGEDARSFDPAPYMVPDYASLADTVRTTMRQRLGRDPDDGEMAQLTAELRGWDKQSYAAQVEGQRQQFEGQSGTVQTVDPVARFNEVFEKRYANELDFVEDKQDATIARGSVEGAESTIAQMGAA